MTTFDDRERAFESKYALDQEQEFKAMSRRNRLLGQWAGEKLGKSGEELDAYAREVVRSDFQEAGDEDVFRKLAADLQGKVGDDEIRTQMARFLQEARAKVADDTVGHN
ncbi:MAG TPA: DUF1476 domain-containing protein [Caulobacteraceae bacterium]|jgi:hypothetical protein